MKRLFILGTISVMVVMLSVSWAGTSLNSSRSMQKQPPEAASINLNSSRSNIYRMVTSPDVASEAQATALLAELDKTGDADEAKLKHWLPANFKKYGFQADHIKKISILMGRQIGCAECAETCKGGCAKWSRDNGTIATSRLGMCYCYEPLTTSVQLRRVNKASPILILLLSDPADEGRAIAVSDDGGPQGPKKKGTQ
jgi:hypothetical protein